MSNNLVESFEIHDTLNPKLWDIQTGKLLPEVRAKLIEIVKYFEEYVDAPMSVCDVQIVGSNASFNYTSSSDLDLHIIVNFDRDFEDAETLRALYTSQRNNFELKHDLKIRGIEVELYVQDVLSNIVSNGVYSICDDEWVKEPKPLKSATKHNTDSEIEKWEDIVKKTIATNDYDTIQQTINTLYLIRHNSIAVDGETGKGNQLFKDIRNRGLLRRLKDASYNAKSHELSLESMSQGQIVHRFDGQ